MIAYQSNAKKTTLQIRYYNYELDCSNFKVNKVDKFE